MLTSSQKINKFINSSLKSGYKLRVVGLFYTAHHHGRIAYDGYNNRNNRCSVSLILVIKHVGAQTYDFPRTLGQVSISNRLSCHIYVDCNF